MKSYEEYDQTYYPSLINTKQNEKHSLCSPSYSVFDYVIVCIFLVEYTLNSYYEPKHNILNHLVKICKKISMNLFYLLVILIKKFHRARIIFKILEIYFQMRINRIEDAKNSKKRRLRRILLKKILLSNE